MNLRLSWQLVRRNAIYQRRAWAAVVTALVEPAVYLAAVVFGLSRVIGGDTEAVVAYAGPALVAAITMNGAVVECTNNVFFRWRQGKLYDSVLCTSLSGVDIGVGDLIFGTLRGWLYGTVLLALLAAVTASPPTTLVLAFAALPLVAAMFAALGLLIVGFVSGWRQLQLVQLAFFVMFLSANTFVDMSDTNAVLGVLAAAMPLTYANELLRACVTPAPADLAANAAVVVALAAVFGVVGVVRLARKLTG